MIRIFSRRVWLLLGLLSIPVGTFFVMLRPVWIAPLFNEFRPLRDRVLATRLLELSERIVLWDTIYEKLTPREIVAVMAHEMGHHALGHRTRGTLIRSASKVLVLGLVAFFAGLVLRRWGTRLGVRERQGSGGLPAEE